MWREINFVYEVSTNTVKCNALKKENFFFFLTFFISFKFNFSAYLPPFLFSLSLSFLFFPLLSFPLISSVPSPLLSFLSCLSFLLLILSNPILSHLIPYYLILSHIISYYPMLSHIISYYLILSHVISYYLILSHLIPYYLILSQLILSYLILSHIVSYYLTSSYLFLSYLLYRERKGPTLVIAQSGCIGCDPRQWRKSIPALTVRYKKMIIIFFLLLLINFFTQQYYFNLFS